MDLSIPTYTSSTPTKFTIQVDLQGGGDVKHRESESRYFLQKRYSDFVSLISQLQNEVGRDVPVALPPKSWLRSTNADFLDERRRGLELFLRRLVKIPHFYSSAALLEFLQLQKQTNSHLTADAAEPDWEESVTAVTQMLRQVRSNVVGGTSERYENQKLLLTAQTRIAHLEKGLTAQSDSEYRHRKGQLVEMQKLLKQVTPSTTGGAGGASGGSGESSGASTPLSGTMKSATSRGGGRKGRVLGETDKTRALNNSGLVSLQKDTFEEQDDSLRQMLGTIQRQKELGQAIRQEVDLQNEQLDELNGEVELTGTRLKNAQRQVGKFT